MVDSKKPETPAKENPPASAGGGDNFEQFRNKIKQSIDDMEIKRKAEMLSRRLSLARAGMDAYEQKNFADAVKFFHQYLAQLEESKGVKDGRITPTHFSSAEERSERLLISGVYWDLAIIFDRTESSRAQQLFKKYLQQFVLFTKGMEYETLCAETLRKYLVTNKAKHRGDFKSAYTQLGGDKCFVATALMDELPLGTVEDLRAWRDEVLSKNRWGRIFVRIYYAVGPGLAKTVLMAPLWVRKLAANMILAIHQRMMLPTRDSRR